MKSVLSTIAPVGIIVSVGIAAFLLLQVAPGNVLDMLLVLAISLLVLLLIVVPLINRGTNQRKYAQMNPEHAILRGTY